MFLFKDSATVYICFAVICLVCIPTSCCVIGVNAHLLRHFRLLTDNILVYLSCFLAPVQFSSPGTLLLSTLYYTKLCSAVGQSQNYTYNVHHASILCWLYTFIYSFSLSTLLKYSGHTHVSSYLSKYEDACVCWNNGCRLMKMTLSVQDGGWVSDCILSPP